MQRVAFLATPWFWALLAVFVLLIYGFSGRLAYINVLGAFL